MAYFGVSVVYEYGVRDKMHVYLNIMQKLYSWCVYLLRLAIAFASFICLVSIVKDCSHCDTLEASSLMLLMDPGNVGGRSVTHLPLSNILFNLSRS